MGFGVNLFIAVIYCVYQSIKTESLAICEVISIGA
jgi:hypothetical protein